MDFLTLKNDILGKDYELSLAFISALKSRQLNKIYRGKNEPTNILSFSLSKKEGEILICKEMAKRDAPKFKKAYKEFLKFLVIHGMLHLKGMKHGSKMEEEEKKYDQKYFHWNRRRLISDTSRSRRVSKGRKKSQDYWHRRK
jgi:probable rRNA maturation factor